MVQSASCWQTWASLNSWHGSALVANLVSGGKGCAPSEWPSSIRHLFCFLTSYLWGRGAVKGALWPQLPSCQREAFSPLTTPELLSEVGQWWRWRRGSRNPKPDRLTAQTNRKQTLAIKQTPRSRKWESGDELKSLKTETEIKTRNLV